MKNKASIISLVMILVLFALMAMGSGSSSSSDVKPPTSVTSGSSASSNAETKSSDTVDEQSTEAPTADTSSNQDAETSSSESTPTTAEITIEEAVIVEQEGIKITAKSFSYKGVFGPEIKLLIENDSSQPITVQARNTSVNGYMVDTMMSADVAAGKKANDTLTLSQDDLDAAGISTIADIEVVFHVFDANTWDTIFDSDKIRIETSAAEGFEYSFDDSGELAYSDANFEIVIKGLSDGSSWLGPEVVIYICNNGDTDVTVQARDVSINGFMVESLFSCDVAAGKHAIDTVTFLSDDLEENGIESIEDIELAFHIFDMESWDTIVDTESVKISFN